MIPMMSAGAYDPSGEFRPNRRSRSHVPARCVFTAFLTFLAIATTGAQERDDRRQTVVASRPATASSPWFWRNLEG